MWCGVLLLAMSGALAETLRVDAMSLSPDAAWRRGDAAQEKEDGVYLLEWPVPQGVAMQVALPRRATPIKADAEAFHANLRKKWAYQYGKSAEIGEIEIGAARWLVCRRPAGDGAAIVFQLATVHEGRAYSLLAFASPQAAGLPKPVYDLLAGVGFGPEARPWSATRVVAAQPGREALEALVHGDAERLGQDGMLTGYGVEYTRPPEAANLGRGLAWFMEGFKWRNPVGRDERLPLSLRGNLEAGVVPGPAGGLAISLRLTAETGAEVEVEVSLLDLCAPAAELDDALVRLARGARAPLERLARERPATCPAPPISAPPRVLLARPGQAVAETLEFPPGPTPPTPPGLSRIKILAARPRLAGGEEALGQSLLRPLGLYFIYGPE